MADPSKYERTYSFTDYQTGNPSAPLPGVQVDNELENVEQSLGEAIDAIKDVRRSDGKLKNGIVTMDSLDPTVASGIGTGALAAAEAAAASADAAADSAVAAAASATAADISATAASGYASNALTSRNEAETQKTLAQTARTGAQTARDFAALWSSAPENTNVNDGVNPVGKSAYHWAQVALDAAAGAIEDGSVTTAKIADEAVTLDKLASDVIGVVDAKADAAATTAALAEKENLLSAATSDNTLDDTDEVVYLTGTTRKRGTLSGLISSIFKTSRTIANAQFAAASFKLFNAAGTPRALTFDTTALTADRKITMPNADIDLGVLASFGSTGEITLSSTAVDITGIPASARNLTLGFSNVTLSAAGQPILLLGTAGGLATTGYLTAAGGQAGSASKATGLSTAIPVGYNAASPGPFYGVIEFQRIGLSNAWSYFGKVTTSGGGLLNDVGGIVLGGALSQIRLTTVAGTPTFAGKVSLDWR